MQRALYTVTESLKVMASEFGFLFQTSPVLANVTNKLPFSRYATIATCL
jgi:hypothetical protein